MRNRCRKIGQWIQEHWLTSMFISAIIGALVAWVFSWILPTKTVVASNAPHKELTCTINSAQTLITKHTNDNRLKITFDGKEIANPYLYNITISNTGNQAILNEDFMEDFSIEFEGCSDILAANIIEATNQYVFDEITEKASVHNSFFIVPDFFLNPGESFTMQVITDKQSKILHYSHRIVNLTGLKLINPPPQIVRKTQRN